MDSFEYWLNKKEESRWVKRALTSKSYKNYYTNKNGVSYNGKTNDELATYGDAIIKLGYCELLLDKVDNITTKKVEYESDEVLVKSVASHYNLIGYIDFDKDNLNIPKDYKYTKEKADSYKYIATAVEAMIGAIYKETKDLNGIIILLDSWRKLISNSCEDFEYEVESNAEKLARYCLNNLDLNTPHYAEPYGSLGPCILDCIYSLQARYFAVVIPLMERYGKRYMNGDLRLAGYKLSDFVSHIEDAGGPIPFANDVLNNRQVLSGRIKSEVCLEVANKLIKAGIQTKEDFYNADKNRMEHLLRSIRGIGDAATNYLFMLTGDSTRVKPDVHIHHCIQDAIGYDVSNEECQKLFSGAVDILKEQYPKLTISALDGLVWSKYRAK